MPRWMVKPSEYSLYLNIFSKASNLLHIHLLINNYRNVNFGEFELFNSIQFNTFILYCRAQISVEFFSTNLILNIYGKHFNESMRKGAEKNKPH